MKFWANKNRFFIKAFSWTTSGENIVARKARSIEVKKLRIWLGRGRLGVIGSVSAFDLNILGTMPSWSFMIKVMDASGACFCRNFRIALHSAFHSDVIWEFIVDAILNNYIHLSIRKVVLNTVPTWTGIWPAPEKRNLVEPTCFLNVSFENPCKYPAEQQRQLIIQSQLI